MLIEGIGLVQVELQNIVKFGWIGILFFMIWQLNFPGMVKSLDKVPICLSLEEVAVRAGNKV